MFKPNQECSNLIKRQIGAAKPRTPRGSGFAPPVKLHPDCDGALPLAARKSEAMRACSRTCVVAYMLEVLGVRRLAYLAL